MPGLEDEDAVGAAYEAHGAELYRFVLRGLGDNGAAQDVVQETFLRAWRAAHRFDPQLASLRVWLFAIARNVMLDHARAGRVRPWQSDLLDPPTAEQAAGTVEDASERLVRAWVVEEALRRCPRSTGPPSCRPTCGSARTAKSRPSSACRWAPSAAGCSTG